MAPAILSYTVDGVTVTKTVVRETLAREDLTGSYFGGVVEDLDCNDGIGNGHFEYSGTIEITKVLGDIRSDRSTSRSRATDRAHSRCRMRRAVTSAEVPAANTIALIVISEVVGSTRPNDPFQGLSPGTKRRLSAPLWVSRRTAMPTEDWRASGVS